MNYYLLNERNDPVLLPDRNPKGINPALFTFDEYFKLTTKKTEFHPDSAYDVSLETMNSYLPKSEYPKLYRTIKIHGLSFEIRLMEKPSGEWGIGVFTGATKVAAVQDEWGTLLVMVAREYRGFGLGPILVKLARTIEPDRESGGFTPAGYRNFIKVYQSMIRDALASGLYQRLILDGKISKSRVKEIITSAKLSKRKINSERDLNSNDPKSWLLYVGEYGDFVIYDKKLKVLLDEDEKNDFWVEQMVKGFVYVQLYEGHVEDWAMLRQFGGDTPEIKKLLINCAVQYSNLNNMSLWLEPDEIDFIDKSMIDRLEGPSLVRGFKSYQVIPTGKEFDYTVLGSVEKRWRKAFDQYDEFYHMMIELAHSKYQI